MKFKLLLFSVLFLFASLVTLAQDDAYKAFLKHTSVVIHKAQKQMIALGKTDAGGILAKAVLLQCNALKMYGKKNEPGSVCSSAKARELAAKIIINMAGKESDYYHVSAEEKKLLTNCLSDAELLKEGKKNNRELSENDKDYTDPKSLNFTNIDIK